jgi:cardiolipin synthase (CMP-forming)
VKRESFPNLVTGARLVSIPVLWGFALADRSAVVGAGLVFAWVSDALDGFLARRLGAESEWGSRFDSVTDTLMFVSALAWVAMLRPGFVREHATLLAIWLGIGVAAYTIGWLRFRRIADMHLYSAKAANGVGFLFAAYLLVTGAYPLLVFYVVMAICLLGAAETLLAFVTLERVDRPIVTVLQLLNRSAANE